MLFYAGIVIRLCLSSYTTYFPSCYIPSKCPSVHRSVPGRTHCWTADSNVDVALLGTSSRKASKRIVKFSDFKPTLMLLQIEIKNVLSLSTHNFNCAARSLLCRWGNFHTIQRLKCPANRRPAIQDPLTWRNILKPSAKAVSMKKWKVSPRLQISPAEHPLLWNRPGRLNMLSV